MKKISFSYRERLHLQKDFNRIFKKGLKLENKTIKIFAKKRDSGHLRRLGLVTSGKLGGAPLRNRTKRRLREVFRTNKHLLEPGLDLIFVSKPETVKADYSALEQAILDLLKNAGLLEIKS